DLGADVHLGGGLDVRMPELEHDLRVPHGEAVLVGDTAPQDEGVVVEAEVRRVQEEDLANLQRRIDEVLAGELDLGCHRRPAHDLGEIEEALARGEMVRPQDELALEVLNLVEREAVGVLARLHGGEPSHTGLLLLDPLLRSTLSHRFPQWWSQGSSTMWGSAI